MRPGTLPQLTEHVVTACQAFETDGKLNIATAHNILYLEVRELGVEAELLNDTRVLAASKFAIVFGLGACDDHFAGSEYERSSLWLANTHYDGGKSFGIVFGVACVQGNAKDS